MLDYYLVFVCIAGGLKCRKDPITKCILKYLNNRNICRENFQDKKEHLIHQWPCRARCQVNRLLAVASAIVLITEIYQGFQI